MSKLATLSLMRARESSSQRIIGETLAAAIGCVDNISKHTCFHHAAGHVLSPPLRADPATPQYILKALAQ